MENLMSTYPKSSELIFTRGEGCNVYSTHNDEYLDFTSGIGVSALGYNHPKMVEAITNQANLIHLSNLYNTKLDIDLAKKICKKTGMSSVFFANSGAESNEGAIKLARKYSFDKYGEGRHEIITLNNSFHGRTITTLKATGQEKMHNYFFPFTEGFVYADTNIDDIKSKVSDKTCAIMIEFVQGEGGVVPLDKTFVKQLEELCNDKDILLIADEVQTGVGRTGEFCAFMHYDVKPDIMTLAKGLGGGVPIGAVVAGQKCKDTFGLSDHGSTFGGNALSCAVATVVVDEMTPEFLADVREKAEYLQSELSKIDSSNIKEIRGVGLMIGIALKDTLVNAEVREACQSKNLLVLTAGDNTVRLLPPLVVSKEEIDKCIQILKEVL